jgi:hypothetical protein
MADNVTITAGSGTTIATDDVSGVHYQRVKLMDGTSDGTDGIAGTAANGLDVDVTRVVPGTSATHLGKAEDAVHADGDTGVMLLGVRNYSGAGADGDYSAFSVSASGEQYVQPRYDLQRISGTVPGTSATAYAIGDQIGTIISFASAARASGGSGYVVGAYVISALDVVGPMDLLLFRQSITLAADSAAFAISDADALNFTGLVQFGGAFDVGNNRVLQAYNLRVPYVCTGSTTLYGALYARAAYTLAASDLTLDLFVERN